MCIYMYMYNIMYMDMYMCCICTCICTYIMYMCMYMYMFILYLHLSVTEPAPSYHRSPPPSYKHHRASSSREEGFNPPSMHNAYDVRFRPRLVQLWRYRHTYPIGMCSISCGCCAEPRGVFSSRSVSE